MSRLCAPPMMLLTPSVCANTVTIRAHNVTLFQLLEKGAARKSVNTITSHSSCVVKLHGAFWKSVLAIFTRETTKFLNQGSGLCCSLVVGLSLCGGISVSMLLHIRALIGVHFVKISVAPSSLKFSPFDWVFCGHN